MNTTVRVTWDFVREGDLLLGEITTPAWWICIKKTHETLTLLSLGDLQRFTYFAQEVIDWHATSIVLDARPDSANISSSEVHNG